MEELKKLIPSQRRNEGEFWIPNTGDQQHSDFQDIANYKYFKKHYSWLYDSYGLIGLNADNLPENVLDLPELLSRVPDDEWEQFVQDVENAKEGNCLDDDLAQNLESEAGDEWWDADGKHGGCADFRNALKLKFRSGHISHILDSMTGWELLEMAGEAGHYIENQGEGGVYMDTDKAAKDIEWWHIQHILDERVRIHQVQIQQGNGGVVPAPRTAEHLQKEWEDRRWAAWQGKVGRLFMDALNKTARGPEDDAALARYNEHDLFEVFNWAVPDDLDKTSASGPFWWTVPKHKTMTYQGPNQPDRETWSEPEIYFTTHRDMPGWTAEDYTREAVQEAAELAWEIIRRGRKPAPKDHPEFKFESAATSEAVDPKDFILQQPEPSKVNSVLTARCPHCSALTNRVRTWEDPNLVLSLPCHVCKKPVPIEQYRMLEAVDPKNFIMAQPDPARLGQQVRLECPGCGKVKLLLKNWPDGLEDQGWGSKCACGVFLRYRDAIPESVDPKDFILDQPDFALRVRGLRHTRHLATGPAPYEMVNNLENRNWRSVTLSEPSADNPTWELRFMRTAGKEIARQRGEAIDANAFKDVVQEVMYHFDGYLGLDMRTDDLDYDYVVTITPLTEESVDPKDFILAQPDPPVRRSDSKSTDEYEFVQFETGGRRRVRFIAQISRTPAGPIWFVYRWRTGDAVETVGQFRTKDQAVNLAQQMARAEAPVVESVYRGPTDPDHLDPDNVRDWLLTGGPDVGEVIHDSPTLYAIRPGDEHTYCKYLPVRNRSWSDIKAPGDIFILVPEPEAPKPEDRAVGVREYYQYGLEVFHPKEDFDALFQGEGGAEMQQVLTKYFQKKARQSQREGDDEAYARNVVSLAQVGGHAALRGHYRHMKPGTLPEFDWKYGCTWPSAGGWRRRRAGFRSRRRKSPARDSTRCSMTGRTSWIFFTKATAVTLPAAPRHCLTVMRWSGLITYTTTRLTWVRRWMLCRSEVGRECVNF